jgi:hypothetical protein
MDWMHLAEDRDQWRAVVNTGELNFFQKPAHVNVAPRSCMMDYRSSSL